MKGRGRRKKKSGNRSDSCLSKENGGKHKQNNEHSDDETDIWLCGACNSSIEDEQAQAIQCEFCEVGFCISCIDMTDVEYTSEVLTREDINWRCASCATKVEEIKAQMKAGSQLKQTLDKMASDLKTQIEKIGSTMNDTLTNMGSSIKNTLEQTVTLKIKENISEENKKVTESVHQYTQNVEKQVTKQVQRAIHGEESSSDTNQSQTLKEIMEEQRKEQKEELTKVKREIVQHGENTKQEIVQHTNEKSNEINEKEERAKNFIVYKLEETQGGSREERKESDKQAVREILDQIDRNDIEVKTVFRIGSFDPEKYQAGKCRPLRVVLHNKTDKESVMRNAYKLSRSDNDKLRKAKIVHDLTKDERKVVEDKIKEAKKKSDDQVFWLVRGPPWNLWLKKQVRQPQDPQSKTSLKPNNQ